MSKFSYTRLFYLMMLIAVWAVPASAQSSETKIGPDAAEASDQGNVSILEGSISVGGQLGEDRKAKGAFYPLPRLSDRYFRFKNRGEEETSMRRFS